MPTYWRTLLALVTVLAVLATGCASDDSGDDTDETTEATDDSGDDTDETTEATDDGGDEAAGDAESLSGEIQIDGSSTVFPLTDAIAADFLDVAPDVDVVIGVSGTGGGFERFCGTGDTQISNASRPIKDEEAELCAENGIEFTEVRVGTDALTMVTNPDTGFVECLTVPELQALWGADVAATTWDQVNPDFPAEEIEIFAPDADSGTYDFFNETILEDAEIEPRQDYQSSADDNVIATGVQGTTNSFGYFGFAYFVNNPDGVAAISFDAGDGCVEPSVDTALAGDYGLSRPLFIYVRNDAEPHVLGYVEYYLDVVGDVITDVGYVPAPQEAIDESRAALGL